MVFRKRYFIWALVLFLIEVFIALYVKDDIIRPHIGDVLVVILIYCFLRAFLDWPVLRTAVVTLVFAYLVETLQYFKIVEVLGLQKYVLARVVIGTYFSWIDMLAYTAGFISIIIAEKLFSCRTLK